MIEEQIARDNGELSDDNQVPGVILRASNITKVYPGTVALDQVTFNVYRGRVNALVGENGAGKSTLIKVIAGVEQFSEGSITIEQEEITLRSPLDSMRHGIGIIYQELDLCNNMSVVDNIFLSREITKNGVIHKKFQKQRARALLQRLEQDIDPDTIVGDLRVGEQQIVAIAKALAQDIRILIMDEPTSSLSATEVEVLFRVIGELKSQGITIIYISHRLDEVLQIGDYITVLRDGRKVAEEAVPKVDLHWIVEKMIGRKQGSLFTRKKSQIGEVLLQVEDLRLPRPSGGGYLVDHVSFELHRGEILGIYGLMGAGRSDLLESIAGARPLAKGKVWLDGQEIRHNQVLSRIQSGIVLVPENRQQEGLVPTLCVTNNMILSSLKQYLNRLQLFLVRNKEKQAVQTMIKDLSIRVANPQQLITSLSGGNQQKIIFAKGLLTHPKLLLLDEPTRGIDVGAKSEIFEIMNSLADQGYGIIFVSSELKEILDMSDRILVMTKGVISSEYSRAEVTEAKLAGATGSSKD